MKGGRTYDLRLQILKQQLQNTHIRSSPDLEFVFLKTEKRYSISELYEYVYWIATKMIESTILRQTIALNFNNLPRINNCFLRILKGRRSKHKLSS